MIQSKIIEKEEDLLCPFNHKLPAFMVIWDAKLQKNQKLLCPLCMDNLESKSQVRSFQKVLQEIEENQQQKKTLVENVIKINITQMEQLQKNLHLFKSIVVQQLDQLIGDVDEWIKHVLIIGQQNVTYSFFEELDNLIKQTNLDEFNQKSIIDQINQINQSWNHKIIEKINLYKQFQESHKCEEILKNLEKIRNQVFIKENDIQQLQEVIRYDNQQKQFEQQLIMNQQVELKLIDDSNKQDNFSYAIVFDKTGSIMVSSDKSEILIWNLENGKLKLSQTYKVQTCAVRCFVYSKQCNSFISGNDDKIICWQQINEKEWKHSQPFQEHQDNVQCLILNKQEDQLISGGQDCSIKVWKVDFIKNGLTFLYSLDHHSNIVCTISLNQSETIMASCGYSEFIIWEKGLEQKWEFKYIQQISDFGWKLHFINDKQFLWVTEDSNIDDILIFELQNGVFKQNSTKTIQLIKNNKCKDYLFFPVIHNQDKNILIVRHKHYIYLIRELSDGTFKIITSLNCQTENTIGTMTNNGQYLLFWNDENKKYSLYEIQIR